MTTEASKNSQRNPFVALCDYASQNNWCWKIFCTTCGHGAFKVSFSKIVHGQHPDDESFWPNGKENHSPLQKMEVYSDFFRGASAVVQMKLSSIVAEAKLADIQAVAKFPEWLGYIGLVIHRCPSRDSKKIISDAFLPQLITLVKNDKEVYDFLQKKQSRQEFLSIGDLSRIESSILVYKGE